MELIICFLFDLLRFVAASRQRAAFSLALKLRRSADHRYSSVQVEQQHLRRFHADQFDVRFSVNRRRVAAGQRLAVQFNFALGDVDPRMASGIQLVRDPVFRRQLGQPELGVLMDGDGPIAPGLACDQVQCAGTASLNDFSA